MNKEIKNISIALGNYIAGFTDGEGSFNVSVKKGHDYKDSWEITASFNISQKDRIILTKIKDTLRCGTIRERADGIVYYEVTSLEPLHAIIIPFFKKFTFLSARKKRNFSIFKEIVERMYRGDHLHPVGRRAILQLREKLNDDRGRKRRYNLQDIYKEGSPETTREIRPIGGKI